MVIRLVVIAPESKKGSFAVRLPIMVGRSEEAKFRIQQDRVSRKHCEFFATDGTVRLRDLGSTNGTFLENEQLPANIPTPVPSGGTVRIGSLVFRVEYESPADMNTTAVVSPADQRSASAPSTIAAPLAAPAEDESIAAINVETTSAAPMLDDAAFEPFADDAADDDGEAAAVDADGEPAAEEQQLEQAAEEDDPAFGVDGSAADATDEAPAEGFAFLDGAEPAPTADAAGPVDWLPPGDDAEPAPPDDDKLGDFLKGLQ